LLAHELTHVLQQQGGTVDSPHAKLELSEPDDPFEREADHVATLIAGGGVAPPIRPAPPAVRRRDDGGGGGSGGAGSATATAVAAPTTAADPAAVTAAVDIIIDRLKEYRTWGVSAAILAQFQDRDDATTRAILRELSRRAHGVDWLFDKLTAEDAETLLGWLAQRQLTEYAVHVVALKIKHLLKGYTSEDDSHEILSLLGQGREPPRFEGSALDALFVELHRVLGGSTESDDRDWLFGDMDRVSAWHLEEFCYDHGGPVALEWAAGWTAAKVYDLLEGYTSHTDSTSIVNRFRHVRQEFRESVLYRLDVTTRGKRNQSAEDALMQDMDKADYERLRTMGGLTLRIYDRHRLPTEAWGHFVVSGLDWISVGLQWLVCGVAGVITGLLSVIWDIGVALVDIVIGVWDLLASVVYAVSGGAAGSAEWLKVKRFFQGLGHAFGHPIDSVSQMWDQMWTDIKLEFTTIEGPLTACREAELFMRKVVNIIATIILTLLTGYALVKAGLEGITALRNFAALVREVGLLRATAQVAAEARVAARAAVALKAASLAELVEALSTPRQLLTRIASRVRTVLLMARDEGYWNFVRSRTGAAAERVVGKERGSWNDLKDRLNSRALTLDERRARLASRVEALDAELAKRRALRGESAAVVAGDQATATAIDDSATQTDQLSRDTAALETEVTGQPPGGGGEPGALERRSGEPAGRPEAGHPAPEIGALGVEGGEEPVAPDEQMLEASPPAPAGPNPGRGPASNPNLGWGRGQIPCFPAGTLVSTPHGGRPIEHVEAGDVVYTFDFTSRNMVVCKVLGVFRGTTNSWVDLSLGDNVLRVTRRHPIWIESEQAWRDAAELAPGMSLRLQDGRSREVSQVSVRPQATAQVTYNLHVAETNNFFAGTLQVLVHNANAELGQPGYRNYVLRDQTGRIYYTGRFGPNETEAAVRSRHLRNNDRFNPIDTPRTPGGPARDRMEVVPGSRTYGEARRLEHELCVQNDTYIGRSPSTWRGNRDYPMDAAKFKTYYRADAC
jgi:hypothetical protein